MLVQFIKQFVIGVSVAKFCLKKKNGKMLMNFVAISEKFMISNLNPLTKQSNPYHNINFRQWALVLKSVHYILGNVNSL